MLGQKLTVLVAAESPDVRRMLSGLAKGESGVAVVGQAENSINAIALARRLRPDVVLVDCHLPHAQGLDSVRLSRIGGFDAASVISEEVQPTRAIVLINLKDTIAQEEDLTLTRTVCLCREEGASSIAFTLQQLSQDISLPASLVFANLRMTEQAPLRNKIIAITDKVVLGSGLAILGGLGFMLTLILASAGVVLALAGAAGLFLGLAVRTGATVWPRDHFSPREHEVWGHADV